MALHSARALIVGIDADLSALLHSFLEREGFRLHCVPAPEFVEALFVAISPRLVVFLYPEPMSVSWEHALNIAAAATRTHVTVVTRAAGSATPRRQFTGGAVARHEVLVRPAMILEKRVEPARPVIVAPPPPSPPASPRADVLAMIEEELEVVVGEEIGATLELEVSLVSDHNFYVGESRTIETGGVFVSTSQPPPVGTVLDVRLTLPNGHQVEVKGTVAWRRERSANPRGHGAGCGLQLTGLPPWAVFAINQFIKSREPLRHVAGTSRP